MKIGEPSTAAYPQFVSHTVRKSVDIIIQRGWRELQVLGGLPILT
jgi:hypothetical protein